MRKEREKVKGEDRLELEKRRYGIYGERDVAYVAYLFNLF